MVPPSLPVVAGIIVIVAMDVSVVAGIIVIVATDVFRR
jgi:hypothetical protein